MVGPFLFQRHIYARRDCRKGETGEKWPIYFLLQSLFLSGHPGVLFALQSKIHWQTLSDEDSAIRIFLQKNPHPSRPIESQKQGRKLS